jgi:polyhydroxyalkanoate synthesis regulator phasin
VEDEQKQNILDSKRGTLENELYAAETDLEVAQAGDSEELVEEPKARVERLKKQIKVIDDKAKKLNGN